MSILIKNGFDEKSAGITQAISLRSEGNMSFDRGEITQVQKNLNSFLKQLGLDLNSIALCIVGANQEATANVANVVNPGNYGRIILKAGSPEIKDFYRIGFDQGYDACLCQSAHTFLGLLHADCAPIFLLETQKKIIGLIHGGRQSLEKGIIRNTLLCLKAWYEVGLENLEVFVGPHICPNCYKYQNQPYNLTELITGQFLSLGLKPSQLQISQQCTFELDQLFFSNHRNKEDGRNLAIIGIK